MGMRWFRHIGVVALSLVLVGCQGSAQAAKTPPKTSPSASASSLPSGPAVYFQQSGRLEAFSWVDGNTYDIRSTPPPAATPTGSDPTYGLKGVWTADDGVHYCLAGNTDQITDALKPAYLYVWKTGEQPKAIAPVGQIVAQTGPELLACSFNTDLAVVGQLSIQSFTELWVIRPSTGALLYHRTYARTQFLQFSASADGRLLAEGTVQPASTVIRSLPDGNELGGLSGRVLQFDLSARLAVVTTDAGGTQIVDWRASNVLWASDGNFHDFVPNPDGDGGALFLWHGQPSSVESYDLWVFRNGQANLVASQVTEAPTIMVAALFTDRCSTSQLAAMESGGPFSEPTGQRTLALTLTNSSGSGCYLFGYPDVAFLDAGGKVLPLLYERTGDQVVTSGPPVHVDLAPGASAYVTVNKYRCDTGDLMLGATARLTLSGETSSLQIPVIESISMNYCGPGDPGSTAHVSPFEPSQLATLSF